MKSGKGVGGIAGGPGRAHGRIGGCCVESTDVEGMVKNIVRQTETGFRRARVGSEEHIVGSFCFWSRIGGAYC